MASMADRETGVICRFAAPRDVIADSEHSLGDRRPRAPLPGDICVVSKTHVSEPFTYR